MSAFVFASPEAFATAVQDLTAIESAIRSAHSAAAVPTTQVAAAAQDEVSTAIATVFGGYAQGYQTLAGQAAAFHSQFVDTLTAGAGAYQATEAANAAQTVRQAVVAAERTLAADVVMAEQTLAADGAYIGRALRVGAEFAGSDGPRAFFEGFFKNIGNIFKPETYRNPRGSITRPGTF